MFRYRVSTVKLNKSKITVKINQQLENENIKNFLNYYEKKIYNFVKTKDSSFKYIQGQLPHSFFKNCIEDFYSDEKEKYNIYNLTQHPNFVGSIVINDFLSLDSRSINFVITYEEPIAKNWLNSKVDYEDVINVLKKLNEKTYLKSSLNMTFIRIFDSTLINFKQINLGSSKPKFELK